MEPMDFVWWMHGLISASEGRVPSDQQWDAIKAMVEDATKLSFPHVDPAPAEEAEAVEEEADLAGWSARAGDDPDGNSHVVIA